MRDGGNKRAADGATNKNPAEAGTWVTVGEIDRAEVGRR